MLLAPSDPDMVKRHEVFHVFRQQHTAFPLRPLEKDIIPELSPFRLLHHRDNVVSTSTKLFSDPIRVVLVEDELHAVSTSWLRRQAVSASWAISSLRWIHRSTSSL